MCPVSDKQETKPPLSVLGGVVWGAELFAWVSVKGTGLWSVKVHDGSF
jgi:hypothetical protein